MPVGVRVRLGIRMRTDGNAMAEVFFGPQFRAGDSVQFSVTNDGRFHDYEILLPEQAPGSRLRIDPTTGDASITVSHITATALRPLTDTEFEAPSPVPGLDRGAARTLTSGRLTIQHNGRQWNGFRILAGRTPMADAHTDARIGYLDHGKPVYIDLADADFRHGYWFGGFRTKAVITDSEGVTWTLTRTFRRVRGQNAIRVGTSVRVSRDRDVFHLPWLTLFPGLHTFGQSKTQALLPGVEYLADEPSSSEADLRGEQAVRRIADDYRLCYPMMSLATDNGYVGLVWDREDAPAPLFDSPDRVFGSGAHVMGLWWPGVGPCRLENGLEVYDTMLLRAGRRARLDVTVLAGDGGTVVPSIQDYVALRGLPEPPRFRGGFAGACELLAHGWLDSAGRVGDRWRHAVWGTSFAPAPAADAPAYMQYLAGQVRDRGLRERLLSTAEQGLAAVPNHDYEHQVSHVRTPVPFLLYGHLQSRLRADVERAHRVLDGFDDNGVLHYVPRPDAPDYSETHFADHANGLAAGALEGVFRTATLSGDPDLVARAVAVLDQQTELYAGTVPRGAQTWEMPLHTPDILGSGRLVSVYVMAHKLTDEPRFLEQARYWAWTGLSMVYLDPPTPGEVGLYATTGVIGATNWIAPNWIGQPVQWCGLVYRSALHDLAPLDPVDGELWDRLAVGITRSGLQMTFPLDDEERQGLLPDFFHLRPQISDGPAITPGTVQAGLPQAYAKGRFYDVQRLGWGHSLIHVPGTIQDTTVENGTVRAGIQAWPSAPYGVLVTCVEADPRTIDWSGGSVHAREYDADSRTLMLTLEGSGTLTLTMGTDLDP
jgi:hypothetical protein